MLSVITSHNERRDTIDAVRVGVTWPSLALNLYCFGCYLHAYVRNRVFVCMCVRARARLSECNEVKGLWWVLEKTVSE